MKQKLMSRKLWAGIIGVITGIALAATGNIVPGTATIISSILGYMLTEGLIDAKTVDMIIDIVEEVDNQLEEQDIEE